MNSNKTSSKGNNVCHGPGLVQVYTGNGKGKTTAALGLCLRAVGAGWRVLVVQFMKGQDTSELAALQMLGCQVETRRYGAGRLVRKPTLEDRAAARLGLSEAAVLLKCGDFQLVVLDEANMAVHHQLFSIDELLAAVDGRAAHTEVAITGRNAHPQLLAKADLVTEMREVKHYYKKGVAARTGAEF